MEYTSRQFQNNWRCISYLTTADIIMSNRGNTNISYESIGVSNGVNCEEETLCTIREDGSSNTRVCRSTGESNTRKFDLRVREQTVSSSSYCCNTSGLIINKVRDVSLNLCSSRCISNSCPCRVRSVTNISVAALLSINIVDLGTNTRIVPLNLVTRVYFQEGALSTNTLSGRTTCVSSEQVTFGCQQCCAITDSKCLPHGNSSTRSYTNVRRCNRNICRGGILNEITDLVHICSRICTVPVLTTNCQGPTIDTSINRSDSKTNWSLINID